MTMEKKQKYFKSILKWPILDADVPFAPFQLPKVLIISKLGMSFKNQ